MQFINFHGEPDAPWCIADLLNLLEKVREYYYSHGYHSSDVYIETVEDNTYFDAANNRYDITAIYKDGEERRIRQKLLYLKGEILDGAEFHKRFKEFYPEEKT